MADTDKLYSTHVLALATSLTRWPLVADLPLLTTVRSRSCGSVLELGLAIEQGRIARVGVKPQACAIGQAAAAIFADHCIGCDAENIASANDEIRTWLAGSRDLPSWPGFAAIAAARDYPARHGALLLPWDAASQLLPTH